jgi:hypothetical protein
MTAFLNAPATAGQDTSFRLDMNSLNPQKGISTSFVISMQNAPGAQVSNIEGLEGFDVLNQGQNIFTNFINGVTTQQVDLHYTVMPKTAGQYTLKANIQYNGQNHETNALQVSVTEGSDNTSEAARDLFIKTVMSHTEAYLGEKIVITYELYSRYGVENFGFRESVTIDDVLAKEIPGRQPRAEYVYIDGNRYAMYEVRQLIIDPLKPGVYTIPSFNFQVNVITSGGSSFFRSSSPMYLQTEEKVLTVKSLPSEGKPDDYSGIVGELRLDGRYSREKMNYGDSFALYMTASGNCNLDGMSKIIYGEMPGLSVYETQKNMAESIENKLYHVQKSFEAILVPEKNGVLNVAPISVSYFNPVTEKYEKAEIPGITIEVLGDMPQPVNYNAQTGAVETVTVNQVNYTDTGDGYYTIRVKTEWIYAALTGLAIFIILAAAIIWIVTNRKKRNPVLESLYKQLKGSKDINEIYNLFNEIIKHCYKLSLKANSRSAIRNNLRDADLAEQIADIMDYMESAKAHEENGHIHLKNKISSIQRKFLNN